MRSRLAAILTSLALVGGAGGALAISQVGTHSDTHGGAADAQYKHHKHHKHKKCKFEGKGKHRHKVCVGGKHKHKKHHKKHHKKPACDRDRNHEGDAPGHEGPGEHRTCH